MLEHVGRRSGRTHQVVLEVIGHPAPGTYLVASGFGAQSQWSRYVCVHPAVRITVASRAPAAACARVLGQAEADAALQASVTRQRRAWDTFKPILEGTLGEPVQEGNTRLPIVELRLT